MITLTLLMHLLLMLGQYWNTVHQLEAHIICLILILSQMCSKHLHVNFIDSAV